MNKTAKTLGVSFLAASQGQHGGYLSHSSSDPSTFKDTSTYSTTFASALILDCLHNCPHTENIKQKLVSFLLSQKSPSGSFNYWDRNDPITQTLPYPDDLDDTFCALAALHRANKKGTNGKTLAQAVTLLALTEIKEGGPYKTWLVPDNAAAVWHDVDPAVNSNIAYFLSLQEVELVSLVELTENAIQSANYTSPYYPNEYPLFYFISRWYRGRLLTSLADAILSRQLSDGSWGSPLKTALALTSLLRLTLPVPKIHQAVSFLCKTQNSDGSWEAEGFCYDPMIQGVSHYSGSPSLTTAFCVEALVLAEERERTPFTKNQKNSYDTLCKKIERAAYAHANRLSSPLKEKSIEWIHRICRKDTDQSIRLLPKLFYECLNHKTDNTHDSFFVTLGQASLFGWIAYTIYDDFLDGEGDKTALPVANVALRETINLLRQALPNNPEFHHHVSQILDQLEAANAWETTHCRTSPLLSLEEIGGKLPNYQDLSQLAERSLGHALGVLGVLYHADYTRKRPEIKQTETFFRHYIIARQLNDDAHDWQDDLKAGHLTAVTTQLLRQALVTLPIKNHPRSILKLLPKLEDLFWQEELLRTCDLIAHHLTKARTALKRNPALHNHDPLLALLAPIEASITRARETHHTTGEFLDNYSPPSSI